MQCLSLSRRNVASLLVRSFCLIVSAAVAHGSPSSTAAQRGVVEITSMSSMNQVLEENPHGVVLYYATWCPHSQALSAAMASAAPIFASSDVLFVQVKEQGHRDVFQHAGITQVPVARYWRRADSAVSSGGGAGGVEFHTFEGNYTTISFLKWLHELRFGSKYLAVAGLAQAREFGMLPLPTAIGWFESGPATSAAQLKELESAFRSSCSQSSDVLCAIFHPANGEASRGILEPSVVEPTASAASDASDAVSVCTRQSGQQKGKLTATCNFASSQWEFAYVSDGEDFALLSSTISVFPSTLSEEQTIFHRFPKGRKVLHPLPSTLPGSPDATASASMPTSDPPQMIRLSSINAASTKRTHAMQMASDSSEETTRAEILTRLFEAYSLPRVISISELRSRFAAYFSHYRDGRCAACNETNIPQEQHLMLFFGDGGRTHSDSDVTAFSVLSEFAKIQHERRQDLLAPDCACANLTTDSGFIIPVYVDWSDTFVVEQLIGSAPSAPSETSTREMGIYLVNLEVPTSTDSQNGNTHSFSERHSPGFRLPSQIRDKFHFDLRSNELTTEALIDFAEDVSSGIAKSFLRSEPEIESPRASAEVFQVVGSSFERVVVDPRTAIASAVLVVWYAPWCGHCRRFDNSVLRPLSQRTASWASFKIARIDATKNDVPSKYGAPSGFPTVDLWLSSHSGTDEGAGAPPSHLPRRRVRFNTTRELTLAAVMDFLLEHSEDTLSCNHDAGRRPSVAPVPKRIVRDTANQTDGKNTSVTFVSSGLCDDAMRQRLAWVPISNNLTASRVLFGQKVRTIDAGEQRTLDKSHMIGGLTDAQVVGVFETSVGSTTYKDTTALELFLAACDAVGEGDANVFLLQAANARSVVMELLSALPGNTAHRKLPAMPEPPFLLVTNSFESRSAVTLPLSLSSTASAPAEWDVNEDGEWQAIDPPSRDSVRDFVTQHLRLVSAVKTLDVTTAPTFVRRFNYTLLFFVPTQEQPNDGAFDLANDTIAFADFISQVAAGSGPTLGVGVVFRTQENEQFLDFFGIPAEEKELPRGRWAGVEAFFYDPSEGGAKFHIEFRTVDGPGREPMLPFQPVSVLQAHWNLLVEGLLVPSFRSAEGFGIAAEEKRAQAIAAVLRHKNEADPAQVVEVTGSSFSALLSATSRQEGENHEQQQAVALFWFGPVTRCPRCNELRRMFQACAMAFYSERRHRQGQYRGNRRVLFVEMDAVANELPGVQIRRLPTLQYWPLSKLSEGNGEYFSAHSTNLSAVRAEKSFVENFQKYSSTAREFVGDQLDMGACVEFVGQAGFFTSDSVRGRASTQTRKTGRKKKKKNKKKKKEKKKNKKRAAAKSTKRQSNPPNQKEKTATNKQNKEGSNKLPQWAQQQLELDFSR